MGAGGRRLGAPPLTVYSVGYEGFDLDGLVERLASSKVSTVVDVRLNPVSRRPGFSKRLLEAALAEAAIGYRHERDLGNPPENRASFHRVDPQEGRRRMRALLEERAGAALERLVDDARRVPVAVLCVEGDARRCHRDVITEMAQERAPGIEVRHIRARS